VKKFYKGYKFSDTTSLFNGFVKDLYSKRVAYKKENNEVMQLSCKLLLNSLYGKFAQKIDSQEQHLHINSITPEMFDTCEIIEIKKDIFKVVKKIKPKFANFIIPIWSSYITSYARMKLFNALPKDVIYMDTDSIITRKDLGDSKRLGELKKEYSLKEVVVVKPKMYYYKDSDGFDYVKLKGVGKINKETFNSILDGKGTNITRFAKWKESLRRDLIPNQTINFIKNIDLEDTKRSWDKKFEIEPQTSKPLII